jgi:quercetin dioxygenase-like cupin family protein
VTEGEGLVQRRGGGREPIRAGDTVQAEAGEWHWHGAGPGTFMTHLAVQEADEDGQTTYWGEHVTDDEYQG